MRAARMQTTLTSPCSVSGRGYWSGVSNTLTFLPAPADTGVQFVRDDLPGKPRVAAIAENRVSMPLRTRLVSRMAEVDMVEHVLAALAGLQIDNVEIHCTASEMPGLDGSSHAYLLALNSAGRVEQKTPRPQLHIEETAQVGDAEQFIRVEPTPDEAYHLEYQLDYGPHSPIGQAIYRTEVTPQTFANELATARTFVTQAEATALQSRGLGTHVTARDLLVFDDHGPVDNELRFPDECARHKTLDLLGDLALTSIDLVGRVVARCSGHQLNGQMAELLRGLFFQSGHSPTSGSRDAA